MLSRYGGFLRHAVRHMQIGESRHFSRGTVVMMARTSKDKEGKDLKKDTVADEKVRPALARSASNFSVGRHLTRFEQNYELNWSCIIEHKAVLLKPLDSSPALTEMQLDSSLVQARLLDMTLANINSKFGKNSVMRMSDGSMDV